MENGLLCGQLEPTRGIGDHDFKYLKNQKFPNKVFKGDLVSAVPEFEWFNLSSDADEIISNSSSKCDTSVGLCCDHYSFIVLASDGLWGILPNCDVLNFVSNRLKLNSSINSNLVQSISDELMKKVKFQVRKKGVKMDNTTILIIAFSSCSDCAFYNSASSSCVYCSQPSLTPQTESIINSSSSIAAKKKKTNRRRNQKKRKTKPKRKK